MRDIDVEGNVLPCVLQLSTGLTVRSVTLSKHSCFNNSALLHDENFVVGITVFCCMTETCCCCLNNNSSSVRCCHTTSKESTTLAEKSSFSRGVSNLTNHHPNMCSYTGLGLMSGSSLDGLDICCVEFTGDVSCDIWSHRVLAAVTVHYEDTWRQRLAGAQSLSGVELIRLHYDYAHFMGQAVQNFLADHRDCHVDFVAAHGHTIFHQPDHRLTFQLGDGETLATHLQCPLVTNFRAKDVALGGQGAPLVASGERFLYSGVGFCLNLGGIANISVRNGKAWDVCPFNIVFNELARRNNSSVQYDKDGELASKGVIQHDLLSSLESLNYYRLSAPKSLGIEWINTNLWPLLDEKMFSLADQARTYVEHVINRIADACEAHNSLNFNCQHSMSCIKRHGDCRILITGGGAHNTFFMCQLKERLQLMGLQLEDADTETVDFKEALVFAYLGLRCLLGAENVFADTTGARENSVAGSIHHPALISSVHKQFRFLLNRQASVP